MDVAATSASQASPGGAATPSLLQVTDVHLRFGGVVALHGVSLRVMPGDIYSIIGPNGAGKTSLINLISGIYRPSAGSILLLGRECTTMSAQAIAASGVSRTFQNIALFKGLNVADNIMLGRHAQMQSGLFTCGLPWGPARAEEMRHREAVQSLLDFLDIGHLGSTPVDALPYGLQKRVEMARALALDPRLLLLDEPMAGMNNEEKRAMVRVIQEVNRTFTMGIILIEHDMGVVMDISDRVLVLDHGIRIAEGSPAEVQADKRVINAYLGEDAC